MLILKDEYYMKKLINKNIQKRAEKSCQRTYLGSFLCKTIFSVSHCYGILFVRNIPPNQNFLSVVTGTVVDAINAH